MFRSCYFIPYYAENAPIQFQPSTEDGKGGMRGGSIGFVSGEGLTGADWLCVIDRPFANFYTDVPRERRILLMTEPPDIRRYSLEYAEQYGVLVGPCPPEGYTGRVLVRNPPLGWWVGSGPAYAERFQRLDDFRTFRCEKTKAASLIVSLKQQCPGHRVRLAFLDALRERFGDEIDCFGRGFNPVEDKLEAIEPYKYHIVLENSTVEHYWTEKLADAWIGWSLPIYFGDPGIRERIPDPEGIEIIDIRDVPSALRHIAEVLGRDDYAARLPAISRCREWAIRESSPYEAVCRIMECADDAACFRPALAEPEPVYSPEGLVRLMIDREMERMVLEKRTRGIVTDANITLEIAWDGLSDDFYVTRI